MAMAGLSVLVVVMLRYGGSHGGCWAMLMLVEAVDMGWGKYGVSWDSYGSGGGKEVMVWMG